VKVWFRIDFTAASRYASALWTAMMTETLGTSF
jgi:hypothetical protein